MNAKNKSNPYLRMALLISLILAGGAQPAAARPPAAAPAAAGAAEIIPLPTPPGSGAFGRVFNLPNGNFVVIDPAFDAGALENVGAVYLYDGVSLALISVLTGGTANSAAGSAGIIVLAGGDFVVRSPQWHRGAGDLEAGAVTRCSATRGCSGAISPANSLVGSTAGDRVGAVVSSEIPKEGVSALANGGYVVAAPAWDNGAVVDAGAVTYCAPEEAAGARCLGAVSPANSLVGSTAGDRVGSANDWMDNDDGQRLDIPRLTLLPNGDYLVASTTWNNPGGAAGGAGAGAVTYCRAASGGCRGAVSPANSLVGGAANDHAGYHGTTILPGGAVVVRSGWWNQGRGAATYCRAASSPAGAASSPAGAASSPAGAASSPAGAASSAPDVTGSCTGVVTAANSLVGVGFEHHVLVLTNGDYLVANPAWSPENTPLLSGVGAVTYCAGLDTPTGPGLCAGQATPANSLVGRASNDRVSGGGVTLLPEGAYVVSSPEWKNPQSSPPAAWAGAVTYCGPASPCHGEVSPANSLVGTRDSDKVGAVTPLPGGDYVVAAPEWDSPSGVINVGAVTHCRAGSCTGPLTAANSLVGSSQIDFVGIGGVVALSSDQYVVRSHEWNNGPQTKAGAVTWCSAAAAGAAGSGCRGQVVSPANSLVGSTAYDYVGWVTPLSTGHYLVSSDSWSKDGLRDVGAVTWCDGGASDAGGASCTGPVGAANSLTGSHAMDRVSSNRVVAELPGGNYLVLSFQWDNGSQPDVGAVTWCPAVLGCNGQVVSPANSLVGPSQYYELDWFYLLSNGNYVVTNITTPLIQPGWEGRQAGTVTWCRGSQGCRGLISPENSLTTFEAIDSWGDGYAIFPLPNGNYVVHGKYKQLSGSFTLGAGNAAVPTGPVGPTNSITGQQSDGMGDQNWAYDAVYDQLIVGMPRENRVEVLRMPHTSLHSGAWDDDANWDYGAPGPNSAAVLAGGKQLALSHDITLRRLTLSAGRVALGEHDLAVRGGLQVDGPPGPQRMLLAGGAGALRLGLPGPGTYPFPLGTPPDAYTPVTVTLTGGSYAAGAALAVQLSAARHPLNLAEHALQRTWRLAAEGLSADTHFEAVFAYLPGDVSGAESQMHALQFSRGWTMGAPVSAANHTFRFSGELAVPGSGAEYTAGSEPLPLDLSAAFVDAAPDARHRLRWTTAQEVVLQGFRIYRAEGEAPKELLTPQLIPAKSPGSASGSSYEWIDPTALRGRTYHYSLELVKQDHNLLLEIGQAQAPWMMYLPLQQR